MLLLLKRIARVKSGQAVCAVVASSRNHDITKNVMIATLFVALHLLAFSVYRCDAYEVNFSHFDYSMLNTQLVLDNSRDTNSQQCPCFFASWDNSNYDVLKRYNNQNISVIQSYETKCIGQSCISYVQNLQGKVIYMRYIEENSYNRNQYIDISTCQYYMGFTEGCNWGNCITINSCDTERLLSASVIRQKIYWNGNYYENALRIIFWYISYVNCDLTCPNPSYSDVIKTYYLYLLPETPPVQKQKAILSQGNVLMDSSIGAKTQQQKGILQYEKGID